MLHTTSGFTLMGEDTPPGMDHQPGGAITISLSGDDEAELCGYWDGLSVGGAVTVPLERQMWGDLRAVHGPVPRQLDGQHRRNEVKAAG